ncbi:major tail protein [Salmonella phage 9NA]|uniref:Major tail protein n=1 Tax=Salmonella phage 9NA TaxID=1113547 RepID=A0A060DAL0_9CAUD|nr:major tail protein [Salmonella phage 9NA]AIB07050.1 major tail protein [Salmonella phage 9NA]
MVNSVFNCSQVPAADVNATRLSIAKVCEPVSGTPWTVQQPNEISSYSADITKTQRTPISTDRSARKGTVTNVEVAPGFQTDITLDTFRYWGDGFLYSKWVGAGAIDIDVTSVDADSYNVATMGAALAAGTLVYATGFTLAANNGLKTVGASSTTTEIMVTGLAAESSPPAEARLYVVGHVAAAGDIAVNGNGQLTSTTLDFTTLGLVPGQYIYVDGFTQSVTSKMARVTTIDADTITLSNSEFTTEAGTDKTVRLFVSSFVRNVPVDSADFLKTEYTMEARYNTTPVIYEYARAVAANQMTINAPLTEKMTMDLTFVAQDLSEPVETPLPGAGYSEFVANEAYNTVTNLNRVRLTGIDESGLSTYLKDVTVTINNNVSGENVLGVMGAAFTNIGNLEITMDTETVMTDGSVLAAIRNNATVNFELAGVNGDGAFVVNIPAMTLGDGSKNLATGKKVKVTVSGTAHEEETVGYMIGFSLFPYLPTA